MVPLHARDPWMVMPSGDDAYCAKRRFDQTPEPEGGGEPDSEEDWLFVVQKHQSRRPHYDLRLRMGDTLKSWAVPEGPCLDPTVRRFAKQVEDHPLAYASFEGAIPEANYGAGQIIVWDRGSWVTLADPLAALTIGEIKFRLAGQKLAGGWMLKRLPDDPTHWLLIKERDMAARSLLEFDVVAEAPDSVITGRPVAAPSVTRPPPPARRKAGRIPGAALAPMPERWRPQLATLAQIAPSGEGWVHEIKYDGYRTLVFVEQGRVRLITRGGHDWTKRYGVLARVFETLACQSAILDGEVVVQDPRGVSSIDLLERALVDADGHAFTFFAFDLCYLDGYDLSAASQLDRKRALETLVYPLIDNRSALQLSEHVGGDGEALFAQASRMGLEGIVSKRADAPYLQARSAAWIKIKRVDVGSFVIIGFLKHGKDQVASLIIAEAVDETLVFAGRVGSGISDAMAKALHIALQPLVRSSPVIATPRIAAAFWVEPVLAADVGFRGRTGQDKPRQPILMSFTKRPSAPKRRSAKPRLVSDRDLAAVQLTNPDREIFSGSGVTKLDVALHYARVGDWLLPEVMHRPLTLLRCPSGQASDCFYQRHAFAGLPDGVSTLDLDEDGERAAFITVVEPKGYLALAQFGAIEFHPWGCRIEAPEQPDRLILDLDPDVALPWARVCDGAEVLRDRLAAMGCPVFLRTTGGKGLHLVVPLIAGHDWPSVKRFAQAVARTASSESPSLFTPMSSNSRRKGRIYIDYLRNARGATAVASYSLRARPGFPAAVPIAWEELRKLSGGDAFNRLNLPRRLERLAVDPWNELTSSAVQISVSMQRQVGIKS